MGGEARGIAKPFFWDGWENPKALKGGYLRRWIFWSDQNYPGIKREEFIRSGPSFPCLQCVPKLSACSARRPGFISSPLLGALASPKKKSSQIFFSGSHPQKKNLVVYLHFVHRTGLGLPQMVLVLSISASSPRAPKTSNCSLLSRRCRFFAHLVRPLARIIPP